MASRFTGLARYMGEVWLCSALSFHRPSSTLSQHLRFLRTMESAALRRLQAALVSDANWQRAAIGLAHARPRACSGAFSLLLRFAKGSGEGRQGWATPRRLSPLRGTTQHDMQQICMGRTKKLNGLIRRPQTPCPDHPGARYISMEVPMKEACHVRPSSVALCRSFAMKCTLAAHRCGRWVDFGTVNTRNRGWECAYF